jgi:hypothetical protein
LVSGVRQAQEQLGFAGAGRAAEEQFIRRAIVSLLLRAR